MFENLREYDDNNFVELVEKTNSATGGLRGTLPRRSLYSSQEALDMGLFPLDNTIPLPPQSEWKKIIEECHGKQIFPFYHQARTNLFNPWDQDGLGYCWAWSLTACVMGTRAVEGQKPVLLAPVSLGYSVNWRNAGNYMDKAIKDASKRGIAPQEYVPGTWNRDYTKYKPGWEAEALKYRPYEWWDVNTYGVDAERVIAQALAIFALGRPLYIGYNWWSHAVEGVGLIWDPSKPYNVVWLIQNSHNDGVIKLSGSRGIPSEAYGIRAITFAG